VIDQGILMLVNNGLASASPPVAYGGGFLDQMAPPNAGYPFWVYRVISQVPNTGLLFAKGLRMRRIQIDVMGDPSPAGNGSDALALADAIDGILNGYAGNLPDPDSTFVSSCFQSDLIDEYDTALRTPKRLLEYEIQFAQ
jgi:hypothetical protein